MLPDTLLRPLEALLNRRLAGATPARELCRELEGTTLAVDPEETPAIAFTVLDGRLRLSFDVGESPAAIVSGPLIELTRFANAGSLEAAREARVTVQGETRTASAFASLLAIARPDFEEEASRIFGDIPARQLGNALRGVGSWLTRAGDSLQKDLREYLQEESRDLPPRGELEAFEQRLRALDQRLDGLQRRVDALSGPER